MERTKAKMHWEKKEIRIISTWRTDMKRWHKKNKLRKKKENEIFWGDFFFLNGNKEIKTKETRYFQKGLTTKKNSEVFFEDLAWKTNL